MTPTPEAGLLQKSQMPVHHVSYVWCCKPMKCTRWANCLYAILLCKQPQHPEIVFSLTQSSGRTNQPAFSYFFPWQTSESTCHSKGLCTQAGDRAVTLQPSPLLFHTVSCCCRLLAQMLRCTVFSDLGFEFPSSALTLPSLWNLA